MEHSDHTRPEHSPRSAEQAERTPQPGRHAYHAPTLMRYGGLAELVQFFPGRGSDGGVAFIDCRRSI